MVAYSHAAAPRYNSQRHDDVLCQTAVEQILDDTRYAVPVDLQITSSSLGPIIAITILPVEDIPKQVPVCDRYGILRSTEIRSESQFFFST